MAESSLTTLIGDEIKGIINGGILWILENSIETDAIMMNVSNEDTNIGSSRRVLAASKTFDERFKDLMAFKSEFGHCNVPRPQSRNNNKHLSSLGRWCCGIRLSYKTIKQGSIPRRYKISESDIKRLENAGFEWSLGRKTTFDERFKDLMAFKSEFGHCNFSRTQSRNNKHLSLGLWCSNARLSYKAMKEGGIPRCKISKADIQRLENAGFEWNLFKKVPFVERFKDLMAFKAEYCNVPKTQRSRNNKHYSLGCWCNEKMQPYKAIKKGGMPRHKLSKTNIQRLDKGGFKWRFR